MAQYSSPHDRGMTSGGAGGMGSMGNAPGPGQMEGGEGYDENGPPAPPEKEGAGETATIPVALLGGKQVKPGDAITFKVVKMDMENGTVEIVPSMDEEQPPMSSMDEEHPAVAAMP